MPRELTTYTVEIQKIVEKGFGLGYINNQPVFVSKTTPGDIVDVVIYKKKSKSLFGKVVTVKTPSAIRKISQCTHFPICGGCHYQDINYDDQLKLKTAVLTDSIQRYLPEALDLISPIIGCKETKFHRNKMEFAFGYDNDKLICGLKKHGTFDNIISIDDCQLLSPISNKILTQTTTFFSNHQIPLWNS